MNGELIKVTEDEVKEWFDFIQDVLEDSPHYGDNQTMEWSNKMKNNIETIVLLTIWGLTRSEN